jgi:hypothetical protein
MSEYAGDNCREKAECGQKRGMTDQFVVSHSTLPFSGKRGNRGDRSRTFCAALAVR